MLARRARQSVSILMDHLAVRPIRFATLGYALRNEIIMDMHRFSGEICPMLERNERVMLRLSWTETLGCLSWVEI